MKKLIKLFFIVILTLFPVSVKGTSKKGRGRSISRGGLLQRFKGSSKKSRGNLKRSESNKSVSTSNSLNKIKINGVDDKGNFDMVDLSVQELKTRALRESREREERLKSKVRGLSEENERHKESTIKLGATNRQLEDKLGHTTQKIGRLSMALTSVEKNILKLGITNSQLETKLKYAEQEMKKQSEEYEKRIRKLSVTSQQRIGHLNVILSVRQENVMELNTTKGELESQLECANNKVKGLSEKIQELNTANSQLKTELKHAEQERFIKNNWVFKWNENLIIAVVTFFIGIMVLGALYYLKNNRPKPQLKKSNNKFIIR